MIHEITPRATQAYGYDGVNRLGSVGETVTAGGSGGGAWSFTHGYDQFGNMWVSSSTGLTAHSATPRASDQFGATTNRLTKAFDGSTLSNPYDEAGNLINHPYVGAMQYDAENRQKQFTSGSTTATYHYDGDGRRVKRVLGGQTTVYVYDAFGMLAAEYSTATPTETGGRRYRTTDHLGSTRLMTNSVGAVVSRHDYVPFGEELQASSSAGNRNLVFGFGVSPSGRHKFTGKERDVESNLDYFGARYFSASLGRFTGPDIPLLDQSPGNPQSWNLYGYVRNNPLAFVDPTGTQCAAASDEELKVCEQAVLAQAEAVKEAGKHIVNTAVDAINALPNLFNFLGEAGGLPFIPAPTLNNPFEVSTGGVVAGEAAMLLLPFDEIGKAGKLLTQTERTANAGGVIRSFVTEGDEVFFRVFSDNPTGGFLVRVPPSSSAFAREALALPDSNRATFIQEVLVPAGTRVQRSRVLPAFGRRGGAEQFQLLQEIPRANFGRGLPLKPR